jgi:thioredoxin-related protein
MACLAAKPIVDGTEAENTGKLVVLRVDVQDPAGRSLAQEYRTLATPTFIFLDAQGQEMWRSVGRIDPGKVSESLRVSTP